MTRRKQLEQNIQELQDNYKKCNIYIMGILKGEQREGTEEILETRMKGNFPKLMSDIKPQFQKSQRMQAG